MKKIFFLSMLISLCTHLCAEHMRAIVFAAGQSKRFGDNKLLATINDMPIVAHPVKAAASLDIPVTVVVGHQKELIQDAVKTYVPHADISFAEQDKALGTGHALQCTKDFWDTDFVIVMNGDHPFTSRELLSSFMQAHTNAQADVSVLVTQSEKAKSWGRFVQTEDSCRIIEAVDFDGNPADHPWVNAGCYIFKTNFLKAHGDELWLHENKGEYYITDLIEIASRYGLAIHPVPVAYELVHGVNTQEEFAHAQELAKKKDLPQAVVLAAGRSSRFKGERSKLLTPMHGKPILYYPIHAARSLGLDTLVVTGHQGDEVRQEMQQLFGDTISFALQDKLIGTGYAMRCCLGQLTGNDILVLYGDHPSTHAQTLDGFIKSHKEAHAMVSIIVCERPEPGSYGRIITKDGITRCVEAKDFHDDPKDYPLVNAGYYLINRNFLVAHIDDLWLHENKNEYYVNDYIEIASRLGHHINTYTVPYDDVRGVNTKEEFALAQQILQK